MKIMNYISAVALALLGLSCAQGLNPGRTAWVDRGSTKTAWDQIRGNPEQGDMASLRRLESITWDSVKHQLTWDVSRGDRKDGQPYQPRSNDRYIINMDNATMTVNGESRRFNEDEAENVRKLMNFIARYALESTVWWEHGEGDPVDGEGAPAVPPRQLPRIPPSEDSGGKAIRIVAIQ